MGPFQRQRSGVNHGWVDYRQIEDLRRVGLLMGQFGEPDSRKYLYVSRKVYDKNLDRVNRRIDTLREKSSKLLQLLGELKYCHDNNCRDKDCQIPKIGSE